LFQEYKIWQRLNDLILTDKKTGNEIEIETEMKMELKHTWFDALMFKTKVKKEALLKLVGFDNKKFDLNFDEVDGNTTNATILKAFEKVFEMKDIELAS